MGWGGGQRQADFWIIGQLCLHSELQAGWGYIVRPCLTNKRGIFHILSSIYFWVCFCFVWNRNQYSPTNHDKKTTTTKKTTKPSICAFWTVALLLCSEWPGDMRHHCRGSLKPTVLMFLSKIFNFLIISKNYRQTIIIPSQYYTMVRLNFKTPHHSQSALFIKHCATSCF